MPASCVRPSVVEQWRDYEGGACGWGPELTTAYLWRHGPPPGGNLEAASVRCLAALREREARALAARPLPLAFLSWLKLVIGPLPGGRGLVGVAMPACCVERGKPWQRCAHVSQKESGWEVSLNAPQIVAIHGTLSNVAQQGCGRGRGDGAGRMMQPHAVWQ